MATHKQTVRRLLDVAGTTFADQAGIKLKNTPTQLYRLLVLSMLLSTRIKAEIAVDAARQLIKAGFGSPRKMLDATWQQRVDALGRGHYVRYDESTATALGDGAQLLLDEYRGDLRRLRDEADGDVNRVRELLRKVPQPVRRPSASSAGRPSRSGRSSVRTWTARRWTGPSDWTCRPTPASWPARCPPTILPGWPRRWSG